MARTIELREFKFGDGEKAASQTSAELLNTILLSAPQGGFEPTEIRKVIGLLDRVEAANGAVVFEDADYEYVKHRVESFRWGFAHKAVLQFLDSIAAAERFEPKKPN